MRLKIAEKGFSVWVSARESYLWATRPGNSWPCSELSRKRFFVQFDSNGLCDFTVNGKDKDCDCTELNAILSDLVLPKLPQGHYWKGGIG